MAKAASQKIQSYLWEGLDRGGRRIKGETSAENEAAVKNALRKQGINPLRIKLQKTPLFGGGSKKITTKDITVFCRQMATMMSSGVPLVQAFEIVGRGHSNKSMQQMLLAIKSDIEAGGTLTDALRKHPAQFNELFVNLVSAGEHAGILEGILHKLAAYLEKTEALKSKIKSAMFYPVAVIVVAFVITCVLMIFVIPQFASLFEGFGADLPALTKMVISMSKWFTENWWLLIGGVVGAVIGTLRLHRTSPKFAQAIDRLSLRIPVIGEILNKSAIARFARTLSTMFSAGTPLVEAMTSVAGACGNIVYYSAVMKMRDEIATGTQLQISMKETKLFPNMVTQMVAIGEESGAVDAMLSKVADWYEQEVDDAVDALTSLLEPLIMAFLGVVIGGLVIAMYLPIFKMGQVV